MSDIDKMCADAIERIENATPEEFAIAILQSGGKLSDIVPREIHEKIQRLTTELAERDKQLFLIKDQWQQTSDDLCDEHGKLQKANERIAELEKSKEFAKMQWIENRKLHAKIAELESAQAGCVSVPVQDCPNCENVGGYAQYDGNGEIEQCQCEFCYTVPNSRFNINAILASAKPQGDKL